MQLFVRHRSLHNTRIAQYTTELPLLEFYETSEGDSSVTGSPRCGEAINISTTNDAALSFRRCFIMAFPS